MTSRAAEAASIPLQLDLDYVDTANDACFAWLKAKYAHLLTPASTPNPAAPMELDDDDAPVDATTTTTINTTAMTVKSKKPQLPKAVLQRVENDIAACDTLRWRVFAFPSHPTQPLNSNYRNEPSKKDGPTELTAHLHKVKKQAANKEAGNAAKALKAGEEGEEEGASAAPSRYALIINTRGGEEAKKRDKKNAKVGDKAPAFPPSVKLEDMMERLVRQEKHAELCQLLGEEDVFSLEPTASQNKTVQQESQQSSSTLWVQRWVPQLWRPLLGGYVSAPTRTDSARFLLFPQSAHPPVDFRDPSSASLPPGKSLRDPQAVPYFLRGSVSWEVEKHNPAGGDADAVLHDLHGPLPAVASTAASQMSPASPGLHYSVHYAQTSPAPPSAGQTNWADTVDVSVAAQHSRTERKYAPEHEKVQRLTLVEDSATIKMSQGNPRYSTSLTATHATVPNSGVKHQHEAPTENSDGAVRKKEKKHRSKNKPLEAVSEDDSVDQLQLQDGYDSSVQYFELPRFWQRLVRPSLTHTSLTSTNTAGNTAAAYGTKALDAVQRGQYRVRWSGGPGMELCRITQPTRSPSEESSESFLTVFGKLWTESWVEVPLPWRMALKLRTQSAVTMPLEPATSLWPPMVSDTTAAPPVRVDGKDESSVHRFREHPYFWATQGPRWDASLVRGFKNDYSGLHHARRWYSILSAELTLNGNGEKSSGKPPRAATAAPSSSEENSSTNDVPAHTAASGWRNTSLTAFVNTCMVDTIRDYPRASVGFSFTSKIPRLAITPFNEIIPHKFECSFSWFAAFKPIGGSVAAGGNPEQQTGAAGSGFSVELMSGLPSSPSAGEGRRVAMTAGEDGIPLLRVSPVETFQHMKCGLTWKFDE